jgi:hypothetical protein
LDWTAKRIDPSKIILGIAGYGYEWITDAEGKTTCNTITYNDAINQAKINNVNIDFDNDSYNLHYNYVDQEKDEEGNRQEQGMIYGSLMRPLPLIQFDSAMNLPLQGTVLWRLGGEDARMWNFYNRELSNAALTTEAFDFSSLTTIPILQDNVGYDGEGEVLNIIASPEVGKVRFEIDTTELLITEQVYEQLPSGLYY